MHKKLGKWTVKNNGRTYDILRNGVLVEGGFFDGTLAQDARIVYANDEAATLAYTVRPGAAIGGIRQFAIYQGEQFIEGGFFVKAAAELAALQHARGTRTR